jgi:glycosyl transferase family 25
MALISFFRNVGAYISTVRKRNSTPGAQGRNDRVADIPVFVINLERNRQRREFALQRLAGLGLKAEIFPAVDGKTLNLGELEKDGIYNDGVAHEKFSRSLSMGEIGCSLSHLRLYKKMLDENIGLALVLEDDAMLVDGAREQLAALIERLPGDCDLLQLIYECRDHSPVAPGIVRFHSKSCMPVASAGYLIRASGARKLLGEGYPVRYPADSFIGRSPRWGTNVYGALPKPVKINNIFPSEIYRGETLKSKIGNRVKAAFVRLLG